MGGIYAPIVGTNIYLYMYIYIYIDLDIDTVIVRDSSRDQFPPLEHH